MQKEYYFPRKKFFEECQDLVATFYSEGDYISENISEYASMLSKSDEKDDFYYCLYLLSSLSNADRLVKIISEIIKGLNYFRVKRKVTSYDSFAGEIDIETYIKRNYIEKACPKEYPSVVKYSTFQMPEYQLTLYIAIRMQEIYHIIFQQLGDNPMVNAFKMAHEYYERLNCYSSILSRRYGISFRNSDTYAFLKKKVIYRYYNRKIINNSFKDLMNVYEKLISFQGMNFESDNAIDLFDHYPSFDDRLFEIWLIRKSTVNLAQRLGVDVENVTYTPIFKARKSDSCVAVINNNDYRIEVMFQNRKHFMPKSDLKWYFYNDKGLSEEIGAIPDLIFLKYFDGGYKPDQIVLVDAKNRKWTLDNSAPIKAEIVQQIYIHDNFIALFPDKYSSILLAHNIDGFQTRKYYHKDKPGYEIDVISLDLNEEAIQDSLDRYIEDLCYYLEV